MKRFISKIVFASTVAVLLAAAGFPLYAEDNSASKNTLSSAGALPDQSDLQEKIAHWKKLKEENPQEFQRQVEEHKSRIKSQLQEVKQKEPQRFEAFKQQAMESRRQRFENMRRENPEMFQQRMSQRMQHFQNWKEKNPQAFQKFSREHPQFSERIRNHEQRFKERFPQGVRQGRNMQGSEGEARGAGEKAHSGRFEPNRNEPRSGRNGDVYSRAKRFQREAGGQNSGNANQAARPEGFRSQDNRRPGNFPQQGMPNAGRGNSMRENAPGERAQLFHENRESHSGMVGFSGRRGGGEERENARPGGGFSSPHRQRTERSPEAQGHLQRESRRRGGSAGG